MTTFFQYLLNFFINFLTAFVIVRFIYYPQRRSQKFVLTFLGFNTIIFILFNYMASIELSIGVGFGLFAIFSILRYRTDPMPSREMTYLFILIALPMINFIMLSQNAYLELILTTALICLVLLFLEKGWGFHFMSSKSITYEKIDLINANNQKELIADLEERTGLMIHYVDINKINFLNDTAEIKVYYEEAKNER
ncbi:MAG: DUF4956 domain-containing protein [Anaerolineaceae bacterium]|jgi:hypothetical protein|nr:MAG: DUF4956 domain-containing protein [Anaerolineaceae bacterium]